MSYIKKALDELTSTITGKNQDYAPAGEFSNFQESAAVVGSHVNTEDIMLAQVGIKLTRIKTLRVSGARPINESLQDSYKDLAGYAVLLYAYSMASSDEFNELMEERKDWFTLVEKASQESARTRIAAKPVTYINEDSEWCQSNDHCNCPERGFPCCWCGEERRED